jgi:hypothetical protein
MNRHAAARSCRQAVAMKASIAARTRRMTTSAIPIWWAEKKIGDRKLKTNTARPSGHQLRPLTDWRCDGRTEDQTMNLGVWSSNLFERSSKPLMLHQYSRWLPRLTNIDIG